MGKSGERVFVCNTTKRVTVSDSCDRANHGLGRENDVRRSAWKHSPFMKWMFEKLTRTAEPIWAFGATGTPHSQPVVQPHALCDILRSILHKSSSMATELAFDMARQQTNCGVVTRWSTWHLYMSTRTWNFTRAFPVMSTHSPPHTHPPDYPLDRVCNGCKRGHDWPRVEHG